MDMQLPRDRSPHRRRARSSYSRFTEVSHGCSDASVPRNVDPLIRTTATIMPVRISSSEIDVHSTSVENETAHSESKPSLPSISNILNMFQVEDAQVQRPYEQQSARHDSAVGEEHIQAAQLAIQRHKTDYTTKSMSGPLTSPTFTMPCLTSPSTVISTTLPDPTYIIPPRPSNTMTADHPDQQLQAMVRPINAQPMPLFGSYGILPATMTGFLPGQSNDHPQYGMYSRQACTGSVRSDMASMMQPNQPMTSAHDHNMTPLAFGQAPDRYSCKTCNKSFSRPSSLKIHMHSHTGEKPHVCPHKGCHRTFSVRSNMKRHEKSCTAGTNRSRRSTIDVPPLTGSYGFSGKAVREPDRQTSHHSHTLPHPRCA